MSIIIPTRNEAADILTTLEHAAAQTVAAEEIIVVDDSTDATPELIAGAMQRIPNLRLLEGDGAGRSGARNKGILTSRADIVVILNADVRLPPDFIERLLTHYHAGAGYVLVGWNVANTESPWARFLLAQASATYQHDASIEWTEGFSCRRDLALQAGLFPITPVPLVAGEDGPFGARLSQLGKKVVDRSIRVSFVAPADATAFFRTYKERAYPHAHYYLYRRSLMHIVLRTIVKQMARGLRAALLLPLVISSWRLCRFSPRGRRDLFHFIAADLFQNTAFAVGEWEGLRKLIRGVGKKQRKT